MYSTSNIIIIIIVFIRVIDMQIYDKKAIIHLTQLWTLNGQGKRESKNHARHLPIFNINGRFPRQPHRSETYRILLCPYH